VWNPKYSEHSLRLFLLQDVGSSVVRKISYAACCGNPDLAMQHAGAFSDGLGAFDAVSVRNDFSREVVNACGRSQCEVLADPTVLLDWRAEFPQLPHTGLPAQYILTYGMDPLTDAVATAARHRLALPVVAVGMEREHAGNDADVVVNNAGPLEWLAMIRGASLVCSKSFHGMLLSMLYGVPFVAVAGKGPRSHRIVDAAARYGATSRVILDASGIGQAIESSASTHGATMASAMAPHRHLSLTFLQNALA
jgi:hypothetical protein